MVYWLKGPFSIIYKMYLIAVIGIPFLCTNTVKYMKTLSVPSAALCLFWH